jgi:hypothetical protein
MSPPDRGARAFVVHGARVIPGRPPSARLVLDVEMANAADEPRWALLPGQLPPDEGGVFAVETLEAAGPPRAIAARILGRGGRLAVRLAAGARVRLRGVGLTWWGPPPERIEVTLELAASATVDGRPLEAWLAVEAAAIADGADASLAGALTLDSRSTEGLVAVPLELGGAIETATARTEVVRAR